MLFIIAFLLGLPAHGQSMIREALDLTPRMARDFEDEEILQAVQYAMENARVHPITEIRLEAFPQSLIVRVISPTERAEYACVSPDAFVICNEATDTARDGGFEVSIPIGNLEPYGFNVYQPIDPSAIYGAGAATIVGAYVAKKIYNRFAHGRFTSPRTEQPDLEVLFDLASNRHWERIAYEGWVMARMASPLPRGKWTFLTFFPRLAYGLSRDLAIELTGPLRLWLIRMMAKIESSRLSDLTSNERVILGLAILLEFVEHAVGDDQRLEDLRTRLVQFHDEGFQRRDLTNWARDLRRVHNDSCAALLQR